MKFLLIVATIGLAAAQYEYAGYRPKQSKTRTPRATAVAEGPPNIAARSSLPVPWGTDRDQSSPWGRDQDGNPYEVRRDTEELSMNLFECTLGPQPKGNCCESFSTNNVGFNCDDATPLMANYVSKTVLFGCPAAPTTNNGSKQKTIGACCSSNFTIVTSSMALYTCHGSNMAKISMGSQDPDVVEPEVVEELLGTVPE
ncbi:unnamed protein product [Diplocarpon coronariae]|uniref:Uncharacterized protein n=1 Tax=Diplocarpon coronariae TaxID=2795749 RepID=A0A218ZH12_9HELO|nr:hypothetical protein JHW43_004921 [Diplocarpon mali]OWP07032.1 hypothetical protein B2J93_7766 [Marssonina coronariae]